MKKIWIFSMAFLLIANCLASSFDWKAAHDKADTLSLAQAISENESDRKSVV